MATRSEIEVKLRLTGSKEFEAALKNIGVAAEKLGKNFKNFSEEVKKATQKITLFTAAAAAASGAVLKFTKSNAEANDNLLDVSEATGVTTKKLQELIFAGQSLGVSSEETTGGVLRFADALGELQRTGGGALAQTFEKTDPAFLNQLKRMKDTGRAYEEFIKRAGRAAQSQEGFALVSNIVGRKLAVATTQIAKGSKGLEDFATEANALGLVLDEKTLKESEKLVNAFSRLGAVISGTSKLITAEFQPVILKMVESFTDFIIKNQPAFIKFAREIVDRFLFLAEIVSDFFKLLRGQAGGEVIDPLAKKFFNFVKAIQDGFEKIQKVVKPVFEQIISVLDAVAERLGFGKGRGVGVGAGLAVLISIFAGPFISALTLGISLLQLLATVLGAVGPAILFIIGLFSALLTPMGAVFALIAASVLNVLGFFDDWGTSVKILKMTIDGFFQNFQSHIDNLLITIQVFVAKVRIYLEDIPGFFRDVLIPAITDFFNKLPGLIFAGFTGVAKLVSDFFTKRGDEIKAFFLEITPLIVEAVGKILQGLPGIFAAIILGALELGKALIKGAGPILIDLFKAALNALPGLIDSFIKKAIESVRVFFALVGPSLLELFQKTLEKIPALIPAFITKAIELVRKLIEVAGPPLLVLVKKTLEALPVILASLFKIALETLKQLVIQVGPILLKLLVDVFKNLPQIIVAAVREGLKLAVNAALAIGDTVKNAVLGRDEPVRQITAVPFAKGGAVSGPGTGTSDSIMARLSNGEYVLRAAAVKKYGVGFLNAMNKGAASLRGFAEGGFVGLGSAPLVPAFSGGQSPAMAAGRPINLTIGNDVFSMTAPEDVAKSLQKSLRGSSIARSGNLPPWYV